LTINSRVSAPYLHDALPIFPALGSLLNSASSDVLMSALDALPEGADSTEPELEVVRLIVSDRLTTNTRTRDPTVLDPVFRRSLMSNAQAFRGHGPSASQIAGT